MAKPAYKKFRVVVCSTFPESSKYRRQASKALLKINAQIMPYWDFIDAFEFQKMMGMDDILLFLGIYGYFDSNSPEVKHRRSTEQDYELALEKKLPRIIYFMSRSSLPPEIDERNLQRVEAFKTKVAANESYSEFTTPDDLAQKVFDGVSSWLDSSEGLAHQSKFLGVQMALANDPLVEQIEKRAKKLTESKQASPSPSKTPDTVSNTFPFSRSAKEAISRANAYGQEVGEQQLNSNLLLLGLLTEHDGPALVFLSAAGVEIASAVEFLRKPVGRRRMASLDKAETNFESSNVSLIRERAVKRAQALNQNEVRTLDLFAALLETPEATAYKWLDDKLGATIPIEWINRTISEWPADKDFTVDELQRKINAERPAEARAARSDSASEVDKLNFNIHANALAEIIFKPETAPPVVIGVYGPWGSGKSTFLKLVKNDLEDLEKQFKKNKKLPEIIIIEYNAWAYTDAAKLWAGLVQKVSSELNEQMTRWQRFTYRAKRRSLRFLTAIILGLLPVAATLIVTLLTGLSDAAQQHLGGITAIVTAILSSIGLYRYQSS